MIIQFHMSKKEPNALHSFTCEEMTTAFGSSGLVFLQL